MSFFYYKNITNITESYHKGFKNNWPNSIVFTSIRSITPQILKISVVIDSYF